MRLFHAAATLCAASILFRVLYVLTHYPPSPMLAAHFAASFVVAAYLVATDRKGK